MKPKPIERQKVSTVLQVFCDEMINALKVVILIEELFLCIEF